jgi:UDP-N-acetylglucosamine--N-acetylmuramyl-(pentapeptide) pyrophosphoryl-undecaprenol N-acetylglucosamine transferase
VRAPFVLAAGGTGGHLFPAEALALELIGRGRSVHLLSDARAEGFAERAQGVAVHRIRAGRLGARGMAELGLGIVAARQILRRLAPAAVIGFGGYPSLPTMLAAISLRLPTLLHEQNAVLGRANRLLAPWVGRIATGFPAVERLRPADRARAVHTGNPVRATILARADAPYRPPEPGETVEVLVLGGSQGAHVFAELVPPALAALPGPVRVGQQARPEDLAAVTAAYARLGLAAEVASFFTDVPARLERAQLVICRAGASTVAELAAIGRPALLVPYPHATDDHQSANACAFAAAGGGWMLPQAELRSDALAARLCELLRNPARLAEAARRARLFGRRDAAEHLARLVLEGAKGVPAPHRFAA